MRVALLFSRIRRTWRGQALLYRACDTCHQASIRKPFVAGACRGLVAARRDCQKCFEAKAHLKLCQMEWDGYDCPVCQRWREYLHTVKIQSAAARALADAGFDRMAVSAPKREQL